jgi:short-subunit dehydrogenase
MVLIQLLLPTTGDGGDRAMTALAETRRELVNRFKGVTAYVRSPAEGLWTAPHGHTKADDVVMVEVVTDTFDRAWWRTYSATLAKRFAQDTIHVQVVQTDLATTPGVDQLWAAAAGRPVDALVANAEQGLGPAFLDQDFDDARHVIDTNITGTIYLVQLVGRTMRSRGQGRILLTGSIAGFMPGTYTAVNNGTKAFIDSFSFALRADLKDSGVTVTCLMPGATQTDFFERADMLDTKVGQDPKDPADVTRVGLDAMMRGDGDVVSGWKNKLQTAMAHVTPAGVLAEQHRKMAEPGSAQKAKG